MPTAANGPADEVALDQSLGYLVSRAATDMRVALDRALSSHGISSAQWVMLARIAASPGATPAELAERLHISRPAVSGLLDRAAEAGLIVRERNPSDARSYGVSATDAAHQLLLRVPPVVDELNQRFARGISRAQRDVLRALLSRLIENVASLDETRPDKPCRTACEGDTDGSTATPRRHGREDRQHVSSHSRAARSRDQ